MSSLDSRLGPWTRNNYCIFQRISATKIVLWKYVLFPSMCLLNPVKFYWVVQPSFLHTYSVYFAFNRNLDVLYWMFLSPNNQWIWTTYIKFSNWASCLLTCEFHKELTSSPIHRKLCVDNHFLKLSFMDQFKM